MVGLTGAGCGFWAARVPMDLTSSDDTAALEGSGGVRAAEKVLHSDLSALISTSELHRLLESCKDEQELRAEVELCRARLSAVKTARDQQVRVKQQARVHTRASDARAPRTANRTHAGCAGPHERPGLQDPCALHPCTACRSPSHATYCPRRR